MKNQALKQKSDLQDLVAKKHPNLTLEYIGMCSNEQLNEILNEKTTKSYG